MIQRIQSVFLLLSGILIAILLFFPFAEVVGKSMEIYQLDIKGLHQTGLSNIQIIRINWPFVFISSITIFVLLVSLLKYKNRKLQIRLSLLSIFLSLGTFVNLYFYILSAAKAVNGTYSFNLLSVFPLIAAVLIYLAIRGIIKDEKLVKSVNRIR